MPCNAVNAVAAMGNNGRGIKDINAGVDSRCQCMTALVQTCVDKCRFVPANGCLAQREAMTSSLTLEGLMSLHFAAKSWAMQGISCSSGMLCIFNLHIADSDTDGIKSSFVKNVMCKACC